MTKVTVKKFRRASAAKSPGGVGSKTVVNSQGRKVRILTINANSKTFTDDLQLVFAKNVAKARRENVKKFGSADRVKVG